MGYRALRKKCESGELCRLRELWGEELTLQPNVLDDAVGHRCPLSSPYLQQRITGCPSYHKALERHICPACPASVDTRRGPTYPVKQTLELRSSRQNTVVQNTSKSMRA